MLKKLRELGLSKVEAIQAVRDALEN